MICNPEVSYKKMIGSILIQNWSVLLCFEMLYRGIGYTALFPLLKNVLNKLPQIAGERYLSQENMLGVLRHPAAVLIILVVSVIAGLYIFFEIVALIIYCNHGWMRTRITVWGIWCETTGKTLKLLSPKRLPVLLLLPILVLSVFSFVSGYIRVVKIPEFILDFIKDSPVLLILLVSVFLLCNLVCFFYLFGLPFLILNGGSFSDTWKKSVQLLKGKKAEAFRIIFFSMLVFGIILLVVPVLYACLTAGLIRLFDGIQIGRGQFELSYLGFNRIWQIVGNVLFAAFLCAVIIILFHKYQKDERPLAGKRVWTGKKIIRRAVTVAATLGILMIYSESELGTTIYNDENGAVKIIAHRAGALGGPENTVAALRQASDDGAFAAEIDVQRLKDGTLVVLHDSNFKRTTGVDLPVEDAEYSRVKNLDAGSFFSDKYRGEPVPTLEDMLKAAKGKINLMIELKAGSHDKELVEDTLALIRKYNMQSESMVASMNMNILKQVKKSEPEVKTVYISAIFLTNEYDLENIDAYSVETTSLAKELVINAHVQDKQVYGWTANTQDNIMQVVNSGADGIITDNVLLAQYSLDTIGKNLFLEFMSGLFFPENSDSVPNNLEEMHP